MNEAFKKFDLSGKTAFFTGGGTGLGYYMARGLARSGAKVMIAARRESVLREAALQLTQESNSNPVLYCTIDLNDRADLARVAKYANETLGGVDIFVGNAAQDDPEPVDGIRDETMYRLLQVNIAANIELFRAFLPKMRAKKWGRVIFSSSIGSRLSAPDTVTSVYGACKSALNAFARHAATEVGHDGITVNSIIIGLYRSQMFEDALGIIAKERGEAPAKAFVESFASMTALGRFGQPHELEGVMQLLASDAGSYITGSELTVDGGMSIMMKPNPTGNG